MREDSGGLVWVLRIRHCSSGASMGGGRDCQKEEKGWWHRCASRTKIRSGARRASVADGGDKAGTEKPQPRRWPGSVTLRLSRCDLAAGTHPISKKPPRSVQNRQLPRYTKFLPEFGKQAQASRGTTKRPASSRTHRAASPGRLTGSVA